MPIAKTLQTLNTSLISDYFFFDFFFLIFFFFGGGGGGGSCLQGPETISETYKTDAHK